MSGPCLMSAEPLLQERVLRGNGCGTKVRGLVFLLIGLGLVVYLTPWSRDKENLRLNPSITMDSPLSVWPQFNISKDSHPHLVNFCLVGLGRAGQFHLNSMSRAPGSAKLRCVVDKDEALAKKTAAKFGCSWSCNLEDALKDERIDSVIIASTTNTHYPFCIQALRAKKAVFTEKPISHNPHEISEVLELAKKNGKPFIVGYQRRVDCNFRSLQQQVSSGAIGALRIIKCCSRDNPLPPIEYLRTSGGIFHDMLSHDFDMIHFLSKEFPESVYAVGHCHHPEIAKMNGDVDTTLVTLTFPSGMMAIVDCCRTASYGYDQRVEAFGDKGMLTCNNQKENTVELATKDGYQTAMSDWSFPQRYEHTYNTELTEFISMIQKNTCDDEDAMNRHVQLEKVATASMLSLKLRRRINISEVDSLRHLVPHHEEATSNAVRDKQEDKLRTRSLR